MAAITINIPATSKEQTLAKVDHAFGQLRAMNDGQFKGINAEELLLRFPIASKSKGKSGGARITTHTVLIEAYTNHAIRCNTNTSPHTPSWPV